MSKDRTGLFYWATLLAKDFIKNLMKIQDPKVFFLKQINEMLILQILTWTNYRFIQVKSRTEKWTRFGSQTDLDLNLASDR